MSEFNPQTPFEGFVYAKLENMTERLNALPCKETNDRLNACEANIENIKGKATVFGAIFGFVAGVLSKIFMGK